MNNKIMNKIMTICSAIMAALSLILVILYSYDNKIGLCIAWGLISILFIVEAYLFAVPRGDGNE